MTYTWDYGLNIDTDTPPAGIYRGGSSTTSGDTPNDYYFCAQPLNGLREGLQINVTRFQFRLNLFDNVTDQNIYFYDVSGNNWVSQATGALSQAGWLSSNTQTKEGDFSGSPIPVTIGAGTWCGLVCTRTNEANNARPGSLCSGQLTAYTAQNFTRGMIWHDADPTNFTAGTDATLYTPGDRRVWLHDLQFTTEQVLVCDIASPDDNDAYLIPALVSGRDHYSIKIEDVVVTAGNSLTINLLDTTTGSDTPIASETAVVDMGATDQMTFDGANVTGITAGDTYDLIITIRLSDGAIKFAWINKSTGEGPISSTDYTTIDHKSAVSGTTRNLWATNTQGPPRMIEFAGTATIGRLQVAAFPIVAHMDSQGLDDGPPLAPINNRLIDALDAEFGAAGKMMWWYAGPGAGGKAATNSLNAACTLVAFDPGEANVGVYDICEVRGRHVFEPGINDFSSGSTSTLVPTMQVVAGVCLTHDSELVITDIPPSAGATITETRSDYIKNHSDNVLAMDGYNAAIFGVHICWPKFRAGKVAGVWQPKNIGVWFDGTDKLHVTAAGATEWARTLATTITNGGVVYAPVGGLAVAKQPGMGMGMGLD